MKRNLYPLLKVKVKAKVKPDGFFFSSLILQSPFPLLRFR